MQSIIKKTAVHFSATPARLPRAAAAPQDPERPAVELLQRDGVVHGLQVRCACGEVTTVEFEYPGEPSAEAAQPAVPQESPNPAQEAP